jgi:hypothetical protein
MTITFENDNDVIIYALEMVFIYARRTEQIFVAQCVWLLASIICLEQGFVIQFDTAKQISENTNMGSGRPTSDLGNSVKYEGRVSPTPWDYQEDPRLGPKENRVHLERRNQVDYTNLDIRDLDLNATDKDLNKKVIESTKVFLAQSRKQKQAFKWKTDQLSRTRCGKIQVKPLTAGQRKYIQCIPKDTISDYLVDRK